MVPKFTPKSEMWELRGSTMTTHGVIIHFICLDQLNLFKFRRPINRPWSLFVVVGERFFSACVGDSHIRILSRGNNLSFLHFCSLSLTTSVIQRLVGLTYPLQMVLNIFQLFVLSEDLERYRWSTVTCIYAGRDRVNEEGLSKHSAAEFACIIQSASEHACNSW